MKAGLTVVHSEFEDWSDVRKALENSGADILVFSPHRTADRDGNRVDEVMKDIPEMNEGFYLNFFIFFYYLKSPLWRLFEINQFPKLKTNYPNFPQNNPRNAKI